MIGEMVELRTTIFEHSWQWSMSWSSGWRPLRCGRSVGLGGPGPVGRVGVLALAQARARLIAHEQAQFLADLADVGLVD
jgi:hypothetical protein